MKVDIKTKCNTHSGKKVLMIMKNRAPLVKPGKKFFNSLRQRRRIQQ